MLLFGTDNEAMTWLPEAETSPSCPQLAWRKAVNEYLRNRRNSREKEPMINSSSVPETFPLRK